MDLFSAMRSFLSVVDTGSFSGAASQLNVTKSAVSKHVAALEQRLGAALITRTTRRIALTEAGMAYAAEAARLLQELAELEQSASAIGGRASGTLRVTAPMSMGITVLAPLFADFAQLHPDVRLDLHFDDQVTDIVSGRFDVAIRVRAELVDSSLIARTLGYVEQRLYASGRYLRVAGTPTTPANLRNHQCLGYSLSNRPGEWRFGGDDAAHHFQPRLRANNSLALAEMVAAGLGIAALPTFAAMPLLRQGRIERVLSRFRLETRSISVLYPATRHLQPKVRAFVDFLALHLQCENAGGRSDRQTT